ncbi:unnamed protein product [Hermetia illucens]|uniref:Arb2 domain-containing protein n=1 Tax=Hermetia illucens TaxID=343691 RepID=A0A7R8Z121_HERIL|nr:FAM172 family protein homolog CG10038 isoform X2 [Hermetia illucens]CAD7093249.1 unnamed protein product [Hermetia illucens]
MRLSPGAIKTLLKVGFHNSLKASATMSTTKVKTIRDFGYDFNAEGKLRKIDPQSGEPGDEPFDFNISKDHATNQRNYEALGETITDRVYELLEENGLHKIYVPHNIPKEQATFVFANKKDLSGSKKLMVLIHGSGVVRAGQWARSLIINHSLDHGTQLPYIKKAIEQGYDVLIANTNDNYRNIDGVERRIPQSGSPTEHGATIWEKYVMGSNPEAVSIVAHSYGGVVTLFLAKKYPQFFSDKVFAIGFTDSVHSMSGMPDGVREYLRNVTRNWVTSTKPLDEKLDSSSGDVLRYSAGHTKHEWTSYACISALFKFFETKYEDFRTNPKTKKQKVEL